MFITWPKRDDDDDDDDCDDANGSCPNGKIIVQGYPNVEKIIVEVLRELILRGNRSGSWIAQWVKGIFARHAKDPRFKSRFSRPYPLQNCTAYNQSGTLIRISCVEGYDGGLPQKFIAIVEKERFESLSPYWELQLHKPTTVRLYAVNVKGSSDPVIMEEVALKGVAKFTGSESVSSVDMSPILIGLGGTATGLGLIVTGVLMALWRRHAATPTKPKPLHQSSIETFMSKAEEEDGNPDLIPTTALTHHLTDRKVPICEICLPRRPRQLEGREMSHDVLEISTYPRTSPNTFYSLQRPHRYSESMRNTAIQESCI
ncbi:hypothetical protein M0802_009800 [Mischocyttarus mexicanus]|nr:hypothetical protein M0802_009800 [Mischocyttarus mexicanus]